MASTSTSYSQSIVLPSIHEMFPEHLMPRSRAPVPAPMDSFQPRSRFVPPQPQHSFSFDVLKSDPRGASLQHIASSRPTGRRSDLTVRTRPSSGHSSSGSSDGDAEMEDVEDGADGEEGVAEEGKKHVCLTCSKRFNRPSSLRIHVNTHTGATPFRCPHPNCGRAFNVNSNMRRHFRNHGTPGYGGGPSPLSLPPHPSSSYPISPTSPTSPPSATWSVSSGASHSPSTPSSAYSLQSTFSPAPSPRAWTPPQSASLSPDSAWSPGTSVQKGYSESDVRSERR